MARKKRKESDSMTDNDPTLWATLWQWATENSAQITASLLSVMIAGLRVIYTGGPRRQVILESLLCGLATVATVPGLEWFGLPESMATFVGGAVGFIGVAKLSAYADKILGLKADK
jgi:lambda family phage holin